MYSVHEVILRKMGVQWSACAEEVHPMFYGVLVASLALFQKKSHNYLCNCKNCSIFAPYFRLKASDRCGVSVGLILGNGDCGEHFGAGDILSWHLRRCF